MGQALRKRPTFRPTRPLAVWVAAAVGFGLLLAVARTAEGPLDDRDPAWQRPGFLDAGDLPVPAPPGLPVPGRTTVVFFVLSDGGSELCQALEAATLAEKVATAVVVADATPGACGASADVVADADGVVADDYGMRRPRGGGPPVGYAVVDATGAIRYRTLDPEVADRLGEVGTIVAALA